MFEQGGEIAVFRACGLHPVFFGQALAGDKLANLTYLLGFADKGEKETTCWCPAFRRLGAASPSKRGNVGNPVVSRRNRRYVAWAGLFLPSARTGARTEVRPIKAAINHRNPHLRTQD